MTNEPIFKKNFCCCKKGFYNTNTLKSGALIVKTGKTVFQKFEDINTVCTKKVKKIKMQIL